MNNEAPNWLEEQAEENEAAKPKDSLAQIVELGEILVAAKAAEDEAKKALDDAKREVYRLETETLPALMEEVGIEEIRLSTGQRVVLTQDVKCGLTEATKAAAIAWLTKEGFDGIVKTEVAVAFSREDRELAGKLLQELSSSGWSPEAKESVHASTLKSFVKEQMKAGADLPMDLFNVFPFPKAVIKK